MKARLEAQRAQLEADTDALTTELKTQWVLLLEEKMDHAFKDTDPRPDATIYSNQLSGSHDHRFKKYYMEALERATNCVIDFFHGEGFECFSHKSGNVTGLTVSWAETQPIQNDV